MIFRIIRDKNKDLMWRIFKQEHSLSNPEQIFGNFYTADEALRCLMVHYDSDRFECKIISTK